MVLDLAAARCVTGFVVAGGWEGGGGEAGLKVKSIRSWSHTLLCNTPSTHLILIGTPWRNPLAGWGVVGGGEGAKGSTVAPWSYI